ncbi:MAG TPA: lysophospholipid acyltransferase family protein [Stellaceae bacterium]|nr:lysophospholipid acyltransferase family protein [Stellaceae bacterium]
MLFLRSAVYQIAFLIWTAALGIAGLPLLLASRRAVMIFGTFWSRGVLVLLRIICGLDYELRGGANLPAGPVIVAMKHQSAWETFATPVLFEDAASVIKRELAWVPFYGWYTMKAGSIAIDRGAGARALRSMLADASKVKAQGRKIVIFPEGTRGAVDEARPYLPGVAALYQYLDLPLVPVAVNSGLFWKRRGFLRRPGTVLIEILPAISPGMDRRAVMERLRAEIETATARLVAEARAKGG